MDQAIRIRKLIEQVLMREIIRMTPADLVRYVCGQLSGIKRRQVNGVVRQLVQEGSLLYTNHLSTTHLEKGAGNHLQVSDRIVLCQGDHSVVCTDAVCLKIHAGASFGAGDHPTTLLSLEALDVMMSEYGERLKGRDSVALDVGMGSGVLAIAAVSLGIGNAVGLDIDKMACHEADINSKLNGVDGKIEWIHGDLSTVVNRTFDLIFANLRPPTLVSLLPAMAALTRPGGFWIISGFRPDEAGSLERKWPVVYKKLWTKQDRDWAALLIRSEEG